MVLTNHMLHKFLNLVKWGVDLKFVIKSILKIFFFWKLLLGLFIFFITIVRQIWDLWYQWITIFIFSKSTKKTYWIWRLFLNLSHSIFILENLNFIAVDYLGVWLCIQYFCCMQLYLLWIRPFMSLKHDGISFLSFKVSLIKHLAILHKFIHLCPSQSYLCIKFSLLGFHFLDHRWRIGRYIRNNRGWNLPLRLRVRWRTRSMIPLKPSSLIHFLNDLLIQVLLLILKVSNL